MPRLARPTHVRALGRSRSGKVDGTEAEKRLAFADAYRMLNNRISAFINLPIASLDRLSLKTRLDAIGKL